MLITSMVLFVLILLAGVIRIGIRLAWGVTKFIIGLGLFWMCPVLFVLSVLLGAFSYVWLPIVIIGLLLGRGYRRL